MLLALLALACTGSTVSPAADSPALDAAVLADSRDGGALGDTADSGDTDSVDTAVDDTADTAELPSDQPTIIYAVRHAEKDSDSEDGDPGLTEEGAARALALVELMHDVPLFAVYATDLARTQETVKPTADDHGLPLVTDIDPEAELAAWILANDLGHSVLHAGHSYTLSDFMEALGVVDYPGVDGYGELWIVTILPDGTVSYVTERYGDL